MKKQPISTLIIVGCICILQSCAYRPCTTMMVNLGPVHSRIVGESDSWSGAFGMQGGVSAHIPFNCKLPITAWAGVNVTMQGAAWEDSYNGETFEGTTRLWYLNIPLTGRYQFQNGLYAEAGIQPGFLLSAKDNFDGESVDWKEYVNTFDLGIPLGIGYDFKNNFGLNFRVVPGLLNINEGDYGNKDRNLVASLTGTYTFPKKD